MIDDKKYEKYESKINKEIYIFNYKFRIWIVKKKNYIQMRQLKRDRKKKTILNL